MTEAYEIIDPTYDVVIVGADGAGLRAVLVAHQPLTMRSLRPRPSFACAWPVNLYGSSQSAVAHSTNG